MRHNFCTIATFDYLPFVLTLFNSIKENSTSSILHALVLTNEKLPSVTGIEWYTVNDFENNENIQAVFQKYKNDNNKMRWALKPFLLLHLLEQNDCVIYLDNDIYFFNRFDFLFHDLQKHSLLLTPHWSCFEPFPFPDNFLTSYQIGLSNAGFIGATQNGRQTLEWWGRLCLFNMEDDPANGFFVDQRYLDMAPVYDPKVGVVRHLGCNLGSVNMHQNKRVKRGNEVFIHNQYPVVFIHFSAETVKHILNHNDDTLKPYFDEYAKAFAKTGNELTEFKHAVKKDPVVIDLKRKIKVRTRFKQFIFWLYQKL